MKGYLSIAFLVCALSTFGQSKIYLNEGFEHDGSMPEGWSQIYRGNIYEKPEDLAWEARKGGGRPAGSDVAKPEHAHNGEYNARLYYLAVEHMHGMYLVSPVIDFSNAHRPQLTFWYSQYKDRASTTDATEIDNFEITLCYRILESVDTAWHIIRTYSNPTDDDEPWRCDTIYLPEIMTGKKKIQIAFLGMTKSLGHGCCVDDVVIFENDGNLIGDNEIIDTYPTINDDITNPDENTNHEEVWQSQRDFWFCIPQLTSQHEKDIPKLVLTAYENDARVHIDMPQQDAFIPVDISLPANTSKIIMFSTQEEAMIIYDRYGILPPANVIYIGGYMNSSNQENNILETGLLGESCQITNKGIHILSSERITAYLERGVINNVEIWALKGAYGREFIVPSQTDFQNRAFGNTMGTETPNAWNAIDIVAIEDVTVKVTLPGSGRELVSLWPYGESATGTFKLKKGQTLTVQAKSQDASRHLGGTIITSNGYITVQWKDDSIYLQQPALPKDGNNGEGTCYDVIGDQLLPIGFAGTEYIVMRGQLGVGNRKSEYVYIMAVEDGTTTVTLTLDDGEQLNQLTLQGRGKTQHVRLNNGVLDLGDKKNYDVLHIKSDKPIIVMHMTGFGCEVGAAILPTIEGCTGSTDVSVCRSTNEGFYLNVMCKVAHKGDFTINVNGNDYQIPASWFKDIPNTGWCYLSRDHVKFSSTNADNGVSIPAVNTGSVVKVCNSTGSFHLAVLNGGISSGCRYGYFSNFSSNMGHAVVAGDDFNSEYDRFCVGDTLTLSATGGYKYLWSFVNPNGKEINNGTEDTFISTNTLTSEQMKSQREPKVKPLEGFNQYRVQISRRCYLRHTSITIGDVTLPPQDTIINVWALGYPKIQAEFITDQTTTCSPSQVVVTNTTEGQDKLVNYVWRLDDGNNTIVKKGYDYGELILVNNTNDDVNYTLTLESSIEYNCATSMAKEITVHPLLNAILTADQSNNCQPLEVNFASRLMGPYTRIYIDYGDGQQIELDPNAYVSAELYSKSYEFNHLYYNPNVKDTIYRATIRIVDELHGCDNETTLDIKVLGYLKSQCLNNGGHTEVVDNAIAATCTESGLTEGRHCTVCGEILLAQQTVPAKGHTMVVDDAVAATLNNSGLTEGCHCSVCGLIFVAQQIIPPFGESAILFADDNVKALCVANWDTNGDGELSYAEAADVTDFGNIFQENEEIAFFDELQYFTGLTSIPDFAFYKCCNLQSVIIPNTVTSIGDDAFVHCKNLLSINIPESVADIGNSVFSYCGNLNSISVSENNLYFISVDGILFSKDKSNLIRFPAKKNDFQYIVPSSVTSIWEDAFADCSNLTSISIPRSVTDIGLLAFLRCYNLTAIYVEETNPSYQSVDGVLFSKDMTNLICYPTNMFSDEYIVPTTVTNIVRGAFAFCNRIKSVKIITPLINYEPLHWAFCYSSLVSIEICSTPSINGTFDNCEKLESVKIGYIGSFNSYAFRDCRNLSSLTIETDTPPTLDPTVFENVDKSISVYVPCGSVELYRVADGWKAFTYIIGFHTDTVIDAAITATCMESGLTEGKHCSVCGEILVAQQTVPAKGHTEVVDNAVAATCTEYGLTEGKHCSVCGEILVAQQTVPAKGHMGNVDNAVAATCTESGLTEGKHCSVCGEILIAQQTVPAKGHTEVVDRAVAATCTESGLTEGKHCSVCGEILVAQQTVPAKGHTEVVDRAVAATCTESGLTEGKHCSVCGEILDAQQTVPAKGHTEVVDNAVAATCTESGFTEGKHCSVCGDVLVAQQTVPAKGHTEVVDNAVAATCTESGLTEGRHCSVCGEVLVAQQTVSAKGHTVVVDRAVAATCTESGLTEGKRCSVCGDVLVAQQTVPAKGHKEVVDNAVAATCTESGLTEGRHCSVCGEILLARQTIPAKGHTIVIDAAVAATNTSTGLTEGRHCLVCNAVFVPQTTIPILADSGNDNNGNQNGNNGKHINYNEWFSTFETSGYFAEQPATENGMYVITISEDMTTRWNAQFCNVLHGLEGQQEDNPFKLTLDVKWESKTNMNPAVIYLLTGKLIRNIADEIDCQPYQYLSDNTEIVIDNSETPYCFLPFEVYNNKWTTIEVNGTIGEKGVDLIGLEFDLAVSNDAYVNAGKFYFKNIEIDLGDNKYYYYADVWANNDSGNNSGTNNENGNNNNNNNNGNGNPNGNNGGTNNGGHNNGNGNQGNNNGGANNGGTNNGNGNQGGNNGGANNGGSNNGHRPNVPVTDPVSAVINQIYNVINLIHDLTTDVDENAVAKINIYTINGNTVVVENADAEIFVYDAMGRLIVETPHCDVSTEIRIDGSGIYIVKVGNVAKRVMVN